MEDANMWDIATKHSGTIKQQQGPDLLAFENAEDFAECVREVVSHGYPYRVEDIAHTFKDKSGEDVESFEENNALACLLLDSVVFCNERKYVEHDGTSEQSTTVIFMLCNDVFAWGCADGENLLNSDIEPLFKMWHADKRYGYVRWVCIKRNEKPQAPFVKAMKAAEVWDDVMEALPDNSYDAYLRARKATT